MDRIDTLLRQRSAASSLCIVNHIFAAGERRNIFHGNSSIRSLSVLPDIKCGNIPGIVFPVKYLQNGSVLCRILEQTVHRRKPDILAPQNGSILQYQRADHLRIGSSHLIARVHRSPADSAKNAVLPVLRMLREEHIPISGIEKS